MNQCMWKRLRLRHILNLDFLHGVDGDIIVTEKVGSLNIFQSGIFHVFNVTFICSKEIWGKRT